jgi:uncharacterized protein (TIGR00730 family)
MNSLPLCVIVRVMKRLCVFCASSLGNNPSYADTARTLGRTLASRGIELVYGGGKIGLMGALADSVLDNGGSVTGVIPRIFDDKAVMHEGLDKMHVVETMHERKALMTKLSDGFIALAGGYGTFDELFDVVSLAQLGFHSKPCGLLDRNGYFQKLIDFLNESVNEGFLKKEHRDMLIVDSNPDRLIDRFIGYKPPIVEKLD